MEAKLDPLFEEAVNCQSLPGVAAAAYDVSGNALYYKAFGTNNIDDASSPSYTTSTPTLMWSTTKLVACVAALQLVEAGKLSLSEPAEKYVPAIANVKVLDGVDSDGKFKYRAPSKKISVLNLFTHTAGFSYDFFDKDTLAWRIEQGQAPSTYLGEGKMSAFETPLIHDPGANYTYGIGIDWLGFIVEAISGEPLEKYIEAHIIKPLGLKNTSTSWADDANHLVVHMRSEDGKLTAAPPVAPAANPEKYGGGHYLVSTLDDYCQFLLAIINKGTHPKSGTKILDTKTVDDYLFRDFIPQICGNENVGFVPTAIPQLSGTGRLLPGVPLGWSCGMMINNADVPGGRKAASGAWAGMGNLYYWVDPKGGKLGLIMTSVLPFLDPKVLELFDALEKTAYGGEVGAQGKTYSVP